MLIRELGETCPAGQLWVMGRCIAPPPRETVRVGACVAGQTRDATTGQCRPKTEAEKATDAQRTAEKQAQEQAGLKAGTLTLTNHYRTPPPEEKKLWDAQIAAAARLPPAASAVGIVPKIRGGAFPYAFYKIAGTQIAKFLAEPNAFHKDWVLTQKKHVPSRNPLEKAWDAAGDALDWAADKFKQGVCALGPTLDVVAAATASAGGAMVGIPPQAAGAVGATASSLARGAMCSKPEAGAAPEAAPKPSVQPKIAIYHKGEKVWYVFRAQPGLAGLAGAPPPPAGYAQETTSSTKPPDAQDGGTYDDPIYTKPWFWAAVGGGVLVLGSGVYFARRKRG